MNETFVQDYRARWADMDFNQHMRNAGFLGCAEETRMRYLDAKGWTMDQFMKRRLGPVVVEDKLVYRKELRLLERFTVDLAVAGMSEDGRKLRLRSRFLSAEGALCATVESFVLWFDLDARKPITPPPELRAIWRELASDDFVTLE